MKNVLEYLENTLPSSAAKVCYRDKKTSVTFEEVCTAARAIGTFIARKTGGRRVPVVVFMPKKVQTVVAFLGAAYSGCYYVPMDSEMPASRIELIFGNLRDFIIIADKSVTAAIEKMGYSDRSYLYEEAAECDTDDALLARIREKQIDTDPLYIVFTSGSTGAPKGVCACHRSVIDYIEQLSKVLKVDKDTVFGNQSPLYTDACLKEIYPTLKFGAQAVFIPKMLFSFPVRLIEFLNEYKINTICWVASALSIVSGLGTFESAKPEYLRTVAFGSEVFPIKQYNLWRSVLPEARFINLYGPTECTGMSCYYVVDREFEETDVIPIGRPFDNTDIFLLTDDIREAAYGEVGEICIRGTCVTHGYYNNPEKTSACFVQNPLQNNYPERVYLTGDLARYNDKGELVFVSRKDYQIKHMGYRIELGEIEIAAGLMDGVAMTAAVYNKEKQQIVLFYSGKVESDPLLEYIKQKLPRYMIPAELIRLDAIPQTANGKIDRVTLAKRITG
ncbi:MAG: amino acid adenylation domain-containing protein [Clostridia bacterium]|nr:amino acid adenylation domain-containing protein [Clostridia bacterium]